MSNEPIPVEGAVGACVLNGCQNAEWSVVAHEALASKHRLIAQSHEREIAYVQIIGRLRDALGGLVDQYRHPDSGKVIVESGHSPLDDTLIYALVALGENCE